MAPLKFGVIGFRLNGQRHARQLTACPKTKLVAVAELLEERRALATSQFGVKDVYDDYKKMIEQSEAEAIAISLPVPLHYPAAIKALEAGKHVMCEKPPARNAREASRMVEAARKRGLVLTWGLQRQFLPEMHVARQAIAAGRLGRLYRVHARYTCSRLATLWVDAYRMHKDGGGVFYDLGVHALNMAWSLLGFPKPVRVVSAHHTAFPDWYPTQRSEQAEDNSLSMIFFEDGTVVDLDIAYTAHREDAHKSMHTVNLRVLGDKGGLHLPTNVLTYGDQKNVKTRELKTRKSWHKDAHYQLYTNFANVVAGKEELLVKPEHGVDLMRMIDAVHKSASTGREVRLGK